MKRQALVIGIYQYSALKDKPGSKAQHLKSAPDDAEAVARLLETYGDFEVHRLPCQEGARQIERKGAVYSKELREAIIRLFLPRTNNTPETAVLFFAGHGRQVEQDGNTEGFLVTSDCNPRKEQWGVSLRWLRKVLQKSRVRQQIVWLDCCNSGELFNFEEADIGTVKGRDRCFVAAAREFQTAFGQQSGEHGELTAALLEGLDPTKSSDGWVSNYTLIDSIEQTLKNAPQHPVLSNIGGEILLAGKEGVRGNICPYKGLNYFDFNEEDPKYFYGREALTTQLLMRAQKSNFIAVMGASGSGKSSVVRAGLLHELRQGILPGSDRWKIYDPLTPGEDPLASLEQVLGVNASQSGAFIKAAAAERVVLVVDQFEEAFTLCRDVGKRERFFQCLMSLVGSQSTGGDRSKVLLVVVMRADFFGKCAERAYAGIAKKIEQNLMTVLPMSEEELRDAIVKPAEQVGLEIDRELVSQMIADVLGSPGNLPLMQYALTDLWEHRKLNRLTISDYTRLGGVRKALEKHADLVFQSLSETEQAIARRIFLELTHVGERSEDTRKQMRLQDLVNSQQSLVQVEEVLRSLVNAKLLVTEEQELKEGEKVPVVNIAHEALIRNWGLLSNLLKENRDVLVRKQEIEDDAKAWRDNRKQGESAYFLQGTRLAAAEDYLQRYADRVPLSGLAQEFVGKSAKHRRNSNLRTAGIVTAVILGLTGLTGWALIEGEDARIRADSSSSESLFASDRKLEALVAGVRAAKRLRMPLGAMGAKSDTRILAVTALRRAVYGIRELNRFEGHVGPVSDVSISPDGQLIASAGEDGTIKIWNYEGELIHTWERPNGTNQGWSIWNQISSVSFSPDGKIIAFDNGQSIQLINRYGKIIKTLQHSNDYIPLANLGVSSVRFSADGEIIASGGFDNQVKLQTLEGRLVAVLAHNDDNGDENVTDVAFSSDNQIIASASLGRRVRIWNSSGQFLQTLQLPYEEITYEHNNGVESIKFSPNNKIIAAGNGNGLIALWKKDGTLLRTFQAHDNRVNSVTFSPYGETIATGSNDGTIKLWKCDSLGERSHFSNMARRHNKESPLGEPAL